MSKTPQEVRKIRLKNDYKQMTNIKSSIIDWKPIKGSPPLVEEYELTINVKSIVGPGINYRDKHVVRISLPGGYPNSAPDTVMITTPQPYHVNWFSNGKWCYGTWDRSEGLGEHVIRMVRTLQFDPEITNVHSAANSEAGSWYSNNYGRKLFPCDRQTLPDPTKTNNPTKLIKFQVHNITKKKFHVLS